MKQIYRHRDGYSIAHDTDGLHVQAEDVSLSIPIGTLGLMNLAQSMLQIVHAEIGGAAPSLNTGNAHADDDH